MGNFEKILREHDWTFEYSDDIQVWCRGTAELAALKKEHERLQCPFKLGLSGGLYAWVHNFVLDLFYENEPGKWYRKGCKYGPDIMAPKRRQDLLTREEFETITKWIEENDA